MGNGYYIVEISSNNSCLFIAAYDVESPESLLIELNENKAEEIMKEFSNDYETMASCLQIMNRRLVLLNPVSFYLLYNTYRNTINKRISSELRARIRLGTDQEPKTPTQVEFHMYQVVSLEASTTKGWLKLYTTKICHLQAFQWINTMLRDLSPKGRPSDMIDVDYNWDLRLK